MITQLDLTILDWIQANLRGPVLDRLMPLITLLGEHGLFWIGLTLVLLIIPKTRRLGGAMAIALVLDYLLCNLTIKPLAARPRPWTYRPDMLEEIQKLTTLPSDFSFPSGHAAASFAAASALVFSRNRWGWLAMLAALGVALSRLYLHVHYPSDVLVGALLGVLCGFLGALIVKKLLDRRGSRKNRTQAETEGA